MLSWLARWRSVRASRSAPTKIEGACKQSGNCCRNLILVHRGKPIDSHDGFRHMAAGDREARMFVPRESISPDGLLRFSCKNLGSDNRCAIYATRPQMCREYPSASMFERGGSLLSGCGYRVASPALGASSFGEVLDDTLKTTGSNSNANRVETPAPRTRAL